MLPVMETTEKHNAVFRTVSVASPSCGEQKNIANNSITVRSKWIASFISGFCFLEHQPCTKFALLL